MIGLVILHMALILPSCAALIQLSTASFQGKSSVLSSAITLEISKKSIQKITKIETIFFIRSSRCEK